MTQVAPQQTIPAHAANPHAPTCEDADRRDSASRPSTGAACVSPFLGIDPPATLTLRARHDGWTAVRQAVFLAALGDGAGIAAAANAAGMSRESAYRLRCNPRAADFAARWTKIDATPRVGPDIATLLDDESRVAARVANGNWLNARATRPRFDAWLMRRMSALQKRRQEP